MTRDGSNPFLVLTAICDASARPAAVTVGHGDAMERAFNAAADYQIEGLDLIELPIAPPAFRALGEHLGVPAATVTVYDLFPLSAGLEQKYRAVAGQFLAAEALWALEEQGLLQGVPFTIKFDLPKGWDKDPKKLHAKLVEAGALDLSEEAIKTFKSIRAAWEASAPGLAK
jgi:hypothetical protein